MKNEKFKVFFNNEWQELSLDEIDKVAGGAAGGWTCEAVCPTGCGFVKVFTNWGDVFQYVRETKECPKCGYSEDSLMIRTKG